jgi:hypothetical protein
VSWENDVTTLGKAGVEEIEKAEGSLSPRKGQEVAVEGKGGAGIDEAGDVDVEWNRSTCRGDSISD